jgi:branched-chain amino acid transport system ATP-binding protein
MTLAAKGLSVRFGGVAAVDGVDLEIGDHQIVGLIGPNGAGKTTLFDTLSGVTAPTSGRVLLDGVDVTRRSATWRARHGVRRTFQRQQAFGWLSVEDNLLVALDWHGGGGGPLADFLALPTRTRRERQRRERVEEVIELCALEDVRHEPAGRLPIGRARMVELARAVVDPPRVLLLDEPTSGLQHSETERLAQIVVEARDRFECAVVLIEHDVGFVMGLAERVVALHLGRVLADGTPTEVRSDQAVTEAYLG